MVDRKKLGVTTTVQKNTFSDLENEMAVKYGLRFHHGDGISKVFLHLCSVIDGLKDRISKLEASDEDNQD